MAYHISDIFIVVFVTSLLNLILVFFTMSNDKIKLNWCRPKSVEYPKIWHTFNARDVDTDQLVQYRIQDLPQSRAEDAYQHMFEGYIQDQPIVQQYSEKR